MASTSGSDSKEQQDRVTIRLGTAADVRQVTRLWQELVGFHTSLDDRMPSVDQNGVKQWSRRLRQLLDDPTCRLYVAEVDGRLVGYLTGFLRYPPDVFEPQKAGNVSDLYVAQEWRRQGAARRLLQAVTDWFQREQVHHIEMNMVTSNPAAVGFWRGVGAEDYMARMWLPVDWDQAGDS